MFLIIQPKHSFGLVFVMDSIKSLAKSELQMWTAVICKQSSLAPKRLADLCFHVAGWKRIVSSWNYSFDNFGSWSKLYSSKIVVFIYTYRELL